jgi:hypothetical protein
MSLTLFGAHSLQTYAAHEGPFQQKAQEIYRDLRRNVIDNVFKVGEYHTRHS